ncbi:hypothetical protein [Actinomadura sp. DC4]|uniref:hypothetical protein n=1 Tax=Actinomadura sp. DC4 TaxID=3055069 RepID=UPI0025AF45C0|nr:hypothetical protein [Actinomadura sp. DC4]MDN3359876.1 hypothetical protein [Actinomadura sp. DC4]
MSFITKAFEISEKGLDAGVEAVEEWNEHRHAQRLLLKLGVAVYAEQRLGHDHDTVERILKALDGHVAEHGEVELDHLRVAKDVLGEEFVAEHAGDEPAGGELAADAAVTTPTA